MERVEGLKVLCYEAGGWRTYDGLEGSEALASIAQLCGQHFAGATSADKARQLLTDDGSLLGSEAAWQAHAARLAARPPNERRLYWQAAGEDNPHLLRDEVVSFIPHPKTMTMAGEWEYFAAGSQHPFPFALAELVDNSLRATCNQRGARRITISLVTNSARGSAGSGMVSVWDNGCGMSKVQLNQWAVMNLTMEDRGLQPQEEQRGRVTQAAAAAGGTKQLCSDLSYFGVGSKNAAFFMGRCIKVTSKNAANVLVHELCIHADELEERYSAAPEDVYKENIRKRMPGSAAHVTDQEQPFPIVQQWLQGESAAADALAAKTAAALAAGGTGAETSTQGEQDTFTRVTIMDLKPEILTQFGDANAGYSVTRQLSHLYHYYLHGPQGNPAVQTSATAGEENSDPAGSSSRRGRASQLPSGDLIPQITIEYCHNDELMWRTDLADVDDDLESRMLGSKRSELSFSLSVPGKGLVEGVLWYFPFCNDQESMPQSDNPFLKQAQLDAAGTQMAASLAAQTTQGQAVMSVDSDDEDDEAGRALVATPIFETFWQGRLIPGSSIASLLFIDSVRSKLTPAERDAVPPECFDRIRGALFFGPSWSVTRNKLKLRDNMEHLLSVATPTDRNIERTFKQWITQCHADHDKTTHFLDPLPPPQQAAMRQKFGDALTVFGKMQQGDLTIEAGHQVLVEGKSCAGARVECVGVNKAHQEAGPCSGGFAVLQPMPEVMWGAHMPIKVSLKRIRLASDEEWAAAMAKEGAKLPAHVSIDPARLQGIVQIDAGRTFPECSLEVRNSVHKKLGKAVTLHGKRCSMAICRQLFRLEPDAPWPPSFSQLAAGGTGPSEKATQKKGKKGKKGAAKAAAAASKLASQDDFSAVVEGGKLLLSEEVVASKTGSFDMEALSECVREAGRYGIVFMLKPSTDVTPICHCVELIVQAGQPVALQLAGDGVHALTEPIHLGQRLPHIALLLKDSAGNTNTQEGRTEAAHASICRYVTGEDGAERLQPVPDLALQYECALGADATVELRSLSIVSEAGRGQALPCFQHLPARLEAGLLASSQLPVAAVTYQLCVTAGDLQQVIPVSVLPGAPMRVTLLPGHPFHVGEIPAPDELASQPAAAVPIAAGAPVPPCRVAACDFWGNVCVQSQKLTWKVVISSPGLAPSSAEFAPDLLGVATVQGLCGAHSAPKDSDGACDVRFEVAALPGLGLEAAAAEASEAAKEDLLSVRALLAPCTLPKEMLIMIGEAELESEYVIQEDGTKRPVYTVGDVVAGSTISDLSFACFDEAAAPAAAGVHGKVMCGWMRRPRKVVLAEEGAIVILPKFEIPKQTGEKTYDIRFWDPAGNTFDCGADVKINVVAGPPAAWQIAPPEAEGSALMAEDDGPAWCIPCGAAFSVTVEALDAHGNRCDRQAQSLPDPVVVVLESSGGTQGANRLDFPGCSLTTGWQVLPAEEGQVPDPEVFVCEATLCGEAGALSLTVAEAEADGSAIAAAEQPLTLLPGEPAKLALSLTRLVQLGVGGSLGDLTVQVTDAWGNRAHVKKDIDFTLETAAMGTGGGGRAARVTAKGSNRGRAKGGAGVLKRVQLEADEAGQYSLSVRAQNRSMALEAATLLVVMQPTNSVTSVEISLEHLPLDPLPAGSECTVPVLAHTEDGKRLAGESVLRGLVLKLISPGSRGKAAQAVRLTEAACATSGQGLPDNAYAFVTPALEASGSYTLTAEWQDDRPDATQTRAPAPLRSPAASLSVAPGPAVDAEVEVDSEKMIANLTAGNGRADAERVLVDQLRVQLLDCYNNPAPAAASEARILLPWGYNPADPLPWPGCELPKLVCRLPGQQGPCGADGALDFGTVSIEQGSGKVAPQPDAPADASPAVECMLLVQVRGMHTPPVTADGQPAVPDAEGWVTIYHKEVLFTDDAVCTAQLQMYSQAQRKQAAQVKSIEDVAQTLQQDVEDARASCEAARVLVADCTAALLGLGAGAGVRAEEAHDHAALQRRLSELEASIPAAPQGRDADGRSGRFGNPKHDLVVAIKKAMAVPDPDVMGALACLGSVNDIALSELLTAHQGANLRTLVVKTHECRIRIADMLKSCTPPLPMPDVLSMPMCPGYEGHYPRAEAALDQAPPTVRSRVLAATYGTDPPIHYPLPHALAIASRVRAHKPIPEGIVGAEEWPLGCLGYSFNLVRPSPGFPDLRATLFWALLGRTLVFDTLENASAYKTLVSQLGGSTGDFITLDKGKVKATGIVCGASFTVPPFDKASYRFAVLAADQDPRRQICAAEMAAIQALDAALAEENACVHAEQSAEAALQEHHATFGPQLETLQAEVGNLDNLMKKGTKRSRGQAGAAQGGARKRQTRSKRGGGNTDALMAAAGLQDDEED